MGNNFTKTTTNFDTTMIQETVNSLTNSVFSNLAQTTIVNQNNFVEIEGVSNCSLTISNESKASIVALLNTVNQGKVQFSTAQKTDLTNDIKKQIQQKNSGVNFGSNNTVEDSGTISNKIQNQITNSFVNEIQSKFSMTTSVNQENHIKITNYTCAPGESIDISNKSFIDSISNSVTKNTVDYITNNQQIESILNKYDLTVKQTNVGLDLNSILIIMAIVFLLITLAPLMFGAGVMKIFSTFIIPLIAIAGIVGTVIFTYYKLFIPAFICLGLSWAMAIYKLLTSVFFSTSPLNSTIQNVNNTLNTTAGTSSIAVDDKIIRVKV